MIELLAALAVFLIFHALPAVRPLRARLAAAMGERPYIFVFSLVSLALAVWLGIAYAHAPYIELWAYHPPLKWLALATMPVSCLLIAIGLSSRNPFSLGAGVRGFDPARPGVTALIRHPAIWGLAIWSAVHIPINGDAASVIMFGFLTLLSAAGALSISARRRRQIGDTAWLELHAEIAKTPKIEALRQIGAGRFIAGIALYVAMVLAHETIIGVTPLPAL